jgi:putative transposase
MARKPFWLSDEEWRRIERLFRRLKDFRRIATRYDKRTDTFLSAALVAATLPWWLN